MNLAVHEFTHLFLSLACGLVIWRLTKQKKQFLGIFILASVLAGFFVDIDHLVDYWLAFGPSFNFIYFVNGCQFEKAHKIYVPLHSYELIVTLLATSYFLFKKSVHNHKYLVAQLLFVLAFSLSLHIATDIVINELPFKTYFFTYRLANGFDTKLLTHTNQHFFKKEKKVSVCQ